MKQTFYKKIINPIIKIFYNRENTVYKNTPVVCTRILGVPFHRIKIKKVLVHFHLFYHNQVGYFIEQLSKINSCEWELYVTYVEENKDSFDKITDLKPDAHFIKVENRGYDVLPFVNVIKSVNIDDFDYVLKIHTKAPRDNIVFDLINYGWRNILVEPLLGTRARFRKNLCILADNKTGMIFSDVVKCHSNGSPYPEDTVLLQEELKRLNFKSDCDIFCAGTMFFARADIYKFLQNEIIKNADFQRSKNTSDGGTLAHVYERLLCVAVDEAGYDFYYKKIPYKKVYDKPLYKRILDWLFSIKNQVRPGKVYKVFEICGFKFKVKKKLAPVYKPNKADSGKKSILLISHELTVTGAPISLLRQAKMLKKAGYSVEVWSIKGGALKDEFIKEGFKPFIVKNNPDVILAFYEQRKRKFDLIICNTILSLSGIVALKHLQVQLVWFIREAGLLEKHIQFDCLLKDMIEQTKNIYAVSEYSASYIRKYNKNVKIIAESLPDIPYAQIKKDDPDTLNFGIIGTVTKPKGVDLLIQAFMELSKTRANTKLYIAGKIWSDFDTEFVEKTKAFSNIIWCGEVTGKQKEEFFNNIDVLVSASLDDSFGLTVLEGAMNGKAIIATKNTGANYIIEDGVSGFVVETGSVGALKNAMELMFSVNLPLMKEKARAQYLKYGTVEREEKELLAMVKDKIEGKGAVKTPC